MQISTIGIDLAKNVFQVHGVDTAGTVVITKKLRRSQMLAFFEKVPPCLVGMEACATSHHWARELKALGHAVRLMPASYVKAAEQQSALMLHRTRDLLVRQRTQLINPCAHTWPSSDWSLREVARAYSP